MAFSKITVNGVTNLDVTETTATADKVLYGYGCIGADGEWIDGSYVAPTPKTASDVTVSGATVTIPAGAYSSQVQKSVATGFAGTPSARKGTVSNHQVSVTPSVTNTTGYITGGTKTGTAVTVSASELVSGSQQALPRCLRDAGVIERRHYRTSFLLRRETMFSKASQSLFSAPFGERLLFKIIEIYALPTPHSAARSS